MNKIKILGQALNIWEKELQTRRDEQDARDLIRESRESERLLARQSAEQHAQEQRNLRENPQAQNKIAEEMKRRNDRMDIYD